MANGKFQPGQRVFLAGSSEKLIREVTVLRYAAGMYTVRYDNGGGTRVREGRIFATKQEAIAAIPKRYNSKYGYFE
jgi:hypothetical protein